MSMAEEIGFDQVSLLHPRIRPYVKVLLAHEFGLLGESPKIHSIHCGSIIRKNQLQYGDRFHLRLMYCKKCLNWQVLMNGDDIWKAPDFILEDNFLTGETGTTIESNIPSLAKWNPHNVKCLLNVVIELLNLFKCHQINFLRSNQRLQRYLFEYETLLSMGRMSQNDVEVSVQVMNRNITILFVINLNVDYLKLQTALPNSKYLTVLVVEFKDNGKTTIQLMPRLELEDFLGSLVEIPDLPPDVSLMDYVPQVEGILQEKVEKVINFTDQRKHLYSHLVQFLEPALINGDTVNFKNVSFLLESNNIYCVLNVHIPHNYPECPPSFQLLPFQFQKTGNPRASDYNGYPYDEGMSHEEVVRSMFTYIKNVALVEFQRHALL